jgi:MFS family permease
MSTSPVNTAIRTATPRTLRYARILGYLVFLAAFFLPAVREPGSKDTFRGSFCAWITLINTFNRDVWHSKDCLAILSGWINPLMLLYVASLFSRRLRLFRRIVAILAALFIVGTWVYFYLASMAPLIGHWLWIAGILLILASEVLGKRKPTVQQNRL